MQVDAKGAIMDVMGALAQLDAAERPAALEELFGRESIDAIAPLLNNLDMLRHNFELVGDAQGYAGSMLAEYQVRAETTANTWQLTKNNVSALATVLGTELLPAINKVLEAVIAILVKIDAWGDATKAWIRDLKAIELPAWMQRGAGRRALTNWWDGDDGGDGGDGGDDAPGRALGGPVRAGGVYRWMEEGREFFQPSVDGTVTPARAGADLQRQARRAAPNVTFNASFNITPREGMSARDIAREVERAMRRLTDQSTALHDGGAYAS